MPSWRHDKGSANQRDRIAGLSHGENHGRQRNVYRRSVPWWWRTLATERLQGDKG